MERILEVFLVYDDMDTGLYGYPPGDEFIINDMPKGIKDLLLPFSHKKNSFGVVRVNDTTRRPAREVDIYNHVATVVHSDPLEIGKGWYRHEGNIEETSPKISLDELPSKGIYDATQATESLARMYSSIIYKQGQQNVLTIMRKWDLGLLESILELSDNHDQINYEESTLMFGGLKLKPINYEIVKPSNILEPSIRILEDYR